MTQKNNDSNGAFWSIVLMFAFFVYIFGNPYTGNSKSSFWKSLAKITIILTIISVIIVGGCKIIALGKNTASSSKTGQDMSLSMTK